MISTEDAPRSIAPETPAAVGPGTVVVRGLAKSFGGRTALHPIDLTLGAMDGGIIGLLGPNGSGKSTLLRLLTGLVPRDSGRAWVDGVELAGDGTAVRRRVAYAPGEIALYREMRAGEHLDWFLRGRDERARERAHAIAHELGLALDKRVSAYSHGMKRQLMFAAALAPDVKLRILDEPTEGLDPTKRGEVLAMLRADAAEGRTILLSSHHLGEVDRACERLVFLNQGRKIADELAEDVHERARRLVRMTFEPDVAVAELASGIVDRATAMQARSARVDGARLVIELAEDDPRAFLSRFLADPLCPRPRSIEFGQLSLAELYRELYGVEGC